MDLANAPSVRVRVKGVACLVSGFAHLLQENDKTIFSFGITLDFRRIIASTSVKDVLWMGS